MVDSLRNMLQIPQILQLRRVIFCSIRNEGCGQWRNGVFTFTGKRGLDNCGKNPKKADLAQQFPVFFAALPPAAAVEGELLRQAKKVQSAEYKLQSKGKKIVLSTEF